MESPAPGYYTSLTGLHHKSGNIHATTRNYFKKEAHIRKRGKKGDVSTFAEANAK